MSIPARPWVPKGAPPRLFHMGVGGMGLPLKGFGALIRPQLLDHLGKHLGAQIRGLNLPGWEASPQPLPYGGGGHGPPSGEAGPGLSGSDQSEPGAWAWLTQVKTNRSHLRHICPYPTLLVTLLSLIHISLKVILFFFENKKIHSNR